MFFNLKISFIDIELGIAYHKVVSIAITVDCICSFCGSKRKKVRVELNQDRV